MDTLPFNDLSTFLVWVSGPTGGGFLIIAWAFAWAIEKFGLWKNLASNIKGLIVLGISIVIGCASFALSQHPEIVKVIEPYFKVVLYSVMMWLTTQISHGVNPLKK